MDKHEYHKEELRRKFKDGFGWFGNFLIITPLIFFICFAGIFLTGVMSEFLGL